MKATVSALSLLLATLPFMAAASELKPLEAGTFTLGNHTISVYYTVAGETYEVVTTIVSDVGEGAAPIRVVGSLPPGQKQVVSVGSIGTAHRPATLELTHDGDLLTATLEDVTG